MKRIARISAIAIAAVITNGGCGTSFLTGDDDEIARVPPCGVEYRCEAAGKNDAAKSLYLHSVGGKPSSLWVILPEREFRVDASAAAGTPPSHYSNGRSALEVAGDVATLTEEGTVTYSNCKRVGKKPLPLCEFDHEPAVYVGVPPP